MYTVYSTYKLTYCNSISYLLESVYRIASSVYGLLLFHNLGTNPIAKAEVFSRKFISR